MVMASDEFANAARPFADQKVFLVFLRSNFRWLQSILNTLTIDKVNDFC